MSKDPVEEQLKTGQALNVLAQVQPETGRLVGRVLGDYRLTALVARGGMSEVYRAERVDGTFEREVAIKISADAGLSDELRSRFVAEQAMLANLNHPNISQLFDAQVTSEGWPYIVMELIDGQSIDEYCRAENLTPREIAQLFVPVAQALAYAHGRLLVHRDIKPSNVLVDRDGRPKLLDFGIAKPIEGDAAALTRARPMTPRYASPEQLLEQPISIASDIYQLGLLLYDLLAGESARAAGTMAEAVQAAAENRSLRLPEDRRRELPADLVRIVEHALRGNPAERYAKLCLTQAQPTLPEGESRRMQTRTGA